MLFCSLFVAVIVDNLARAQSHADFGMITEHEDEVIQSKVCDYCLIIIKIHTISLVLSVTNKDD